MTNILHTPQACRRTVVAAFAVALFTGLGAGSLFAQGYYPPTDSPIDGNVNLQSHRGQPDAVGRRSWCQLRLGSMWRWMRRFRRRSALRWLTNSMGLRSAAVSISQGWLGRFQNTGRRRLQPGLRLRSRSDAGMSRRRRILSADLETVTTAAVTPNPKNAPGVVKSAIKLIAVPSSAGAIDLDVDDLVGDAVAAAAAYTNKIVSAAMGAAKKIDSTDLANVEQDIVSHAVKESVAAGASYLIDETLAAAEKGRASGVSSRAIAAAAFQFRDGGPVTGIALTNVNVGLVAGGAIRGAGVAQVANIVAGVNAATGERFFGLCGASRRRIYNTAAVSTDPAASAAAVLASINAGNKNYIPAILARRCGMAESQRHRLAGRCGWCVEKNESRWVEHPARRISSKRS